MGTPRLNGDRRKASVTAVVKWVVLLSLVLFHVVTTDTDVQHLLQHILGVAVK